MSIDVVQLGSMGGFSRHPYCIHSSILLVQVNMSRSAITSTPKLMISSCFSARRRRKAGRQPFYGTGWAGRVPVGSNPAQYNPNYNTQQPQYGQAPPPTYNQQSGYGANQSYFGGQRDVELQHPQNTYGGQDFPPPSGPPPGKHM